MTNRRVTHNDLTWLTHYRNFPIGTSGYDMTQIHYNTSRNKHRVTIHRKYRWIHSEVTITSTHIVEYNEHIHKFWNMSSIAWQLALTKVPRICGRKFVILTHYLKGRQRIESRIVSEHNYIFCNSKLNPWKSTIDWCVSCSSRRVWRICND